jgi:hypothetical protein
MKRILSAQTYIKIMNHLLPERKIWVNSFYVNNYERLGVLRGDDLIFNQSF